MASRLDQATTSYGVVFLTSVQAGVSLIKAVGVHERCLRIFVRSYPRGVASRVLGELLGGDLVVLAWKLFFRF